MCSDILMVVTIILCEDCGESFSYAIGDHLYFAETNIFPLPDA